MARNRLTWHNVAAPDYGNAMQGYAQANRMFQSALEGLSGSLGSFSEAQKAEEQRKALEEQQLAEAAFNRNLIANVGDIEAQDAIIRSAAQDPKLGNKFLTNLMTDFRQSQLSNETSSTNLSQTRLENARTNRDNELIDGFRPVSGAVAGYVSGGGQNPLDAMTPKQRADFEALPLNTQRDLMSFWSGEQTSVQNRTQSATEFANTQQDRGETRAGVELARYIMENAINDQDAQTLLSDVENPHVRAAAIRALSSVPGASGISNSGFGSSSGSPNAATSSVPEDRVNIALDVAADSVNTRDAQANDLYNLDGLITAKDDKRPQHEIVNSLVAEDGPFAGEDKRVVLGRLQKIKQDYPGITDGMAAYLLTNNVKPGAGIIERMFLNTPTGLGYRGIRHLMGYSDVTGDGIRLDDRALDAQARITNSPAYRQQLEAAKEREVIMGRLNEARIELEKARRDAQAAQERQVTSRGRFDPSPYVNRALELENYVSEMASAIQNDERMGRLIEDPQNPGQVITEGELRRRSERQETANNRGTQNSREDTSSNRNVTIPELLEKPVEELTPNEASKLLNMSPEELEKLTPTQRANLNNKLVRLFNR